MTANQILGNANYPAISYSGFRGVNREVEPTIAQIKEDLGLIAGQGYKVIRTYDLQHDFAGNVLQAISELKAADSSFEMYVFLGAWIECEGAWTRDANRNAGKILENGVEIDKAARLAIQYPDIVKVISVGNEAMVYWNYWYSVDPAIILKWVNNLQLLKTQGHISTDVLITCNDNYAAWGGDSKYHTSTLSDLVNAVDFISVHTYPFYETDTLEQGVPLVTAASASAITQYESVKSYVESLGSTTPVHIGETGWATESSDGYAEIANVANQTAYYNAFHSWSANNNVTCFIFSAFDEQWKDDNDATHSECNFGIFNLDRTLKN